MPWRQVMKRHLFAYAMKSQMRYRYVELYLQYIDYYPTLEICKTGPGGRVCDRYVFGSFVVTKRFPDIVLYVCANDQERTVCGVVRTVKSK